MWSTRDIATELSAETLRRLVAEELPAVRFQGFATASETTRLGQALLDLPVRTNSIDSITRIGISQYEQGIRGSKEEYFGLARQLRGDFDAAFAASFDPVERFVATLRTIGVPTDVMVEPGFGRYWAGNGKVRVGDTPIHVDFAPQDAVDWAIHDSVAQLAWNLYLRDPGGRGHLELWDRRWEPEDDRHLVEGSYHHDPVVVSDVDNLVVPTVPGDVVILNSRMYHRVAESDGRLAFGSFVSVFEDGRFRLWS